MFETLETRQLFCALPFSSANGDGSAIGMDGTVVTAEHELGPADVTGASTAASASSADAIASNSNGANS